MDTSRCFVIAEIGVNHNGSLQMARDLIDASVEAGADAVKFQTFFADELVTKSADKADYQVENTQNEDSQYNMLKALELSEDDFLQMRKYCDEKGIEFLSTPFSENAVDLLARVGVKAYKVSSGDLTHLNLLRHIASKGKPIILSTGMGNLSEVEEAVTAIHDEAPVEVSILHCVSDYPADPATCNLAAIDTMAQAFGVPVGWSDHTLGNTISYAAVARGAKLIEKHITLDCDLEGPDHRASMPPQEFKDFVAGIRAIEASIGDGVKRPTKAEQRTGLVARRSIVAARDLKAGDVLTEGDVKIVRPGTGLRPRELGAVIGARVAKDVDADTPLTWKHLHG